MKKSFSYGRKIRVPLDSKGYNSNEYYLFTSIEYDESDLEEFTVINKNEFKELAKELDEVQRSIIKEETGITELPMDISKEKEKMKKQMSFKKYKSNKEVDEEDITLPKTGLDKLKWKIKNKNK
jgi:hypothetical protein